MGKISTLDITLGALWVGLMAIGANIAIWFPFLMLPIGGVSVPLSMQTFFAVMAGLMLGKRLASISVSAYLLIGIAGVPVFAQMKAGLFVLFDYTGGFLLSFIAVAYVTGWIAESKGLNKKITFIAASFSGVIVNYLIGVTYMFIAMNTWLELDINYIATWGAMTPFLIKDICLTLMGATVMVTLLKRLPNRILLQRS